MDFKRALGEATALSSMLLLITIFVILTYNGLTTGHYELTINSNLFMEHYIELVLLILGLFFYIKARHIKVTLHPRRQM